MKFSRPIVSGCEDAEVVFCVGGEFPTSVIDSFEDAIGIVLRKGLEVRVASCL